MVNKEEVTFHSHALLLIEFHPSSLFHLPSFIVTYYKHGALKNVIVVIVVVVVVLDFCKCGFV